MLKRSGFLSLLINCFPFVREFRLRKKIRYRRRINRRRKLPKDELKQLRKYIMMSGTIRRL